MRRLDLVGKDRFDSLRNVVATASACTGGEKPSLGLVAKAVIDFITGSLIDNPRRVGRELRSELA